MPIRTPHAESHPTTYRTPYLTKLPQGSEQQTDDDPSGFEQGPLPFPKGNASNYPHIGAADYSTR